MFSDATFDDIVAGFYRAAGGELAWNAALAPVQRAFKAWAVYLHGLDTRLGRIEFAHIASSISPEAEIDYLQTYHKIDPRVNLLADSAQLGDWFNCWEVFDDAFVAKDPFYQQYLIPYGGRYVSGSPLVRHQDTLVIFGVHRGFGSEKLNALELDACKRLSRHLAEAIKLYFTTIKLQAKVSLGLQLLSRLHLPIVVVDAGRKIVQMNAAGQELLSRSKAIFQENDALYLESSRDDANFLLEIRRLLNAPRESPTRQTFIRTATRTGGQSIALCISALRPDETLHAFTDHPVAMIAMHDTQAQRSIDPYLVQMAYGFTPAETRVAIAVSHGASPKEIAREFGISPHTVRTQMKSVFAKVGVSKQTELVARLMSLPVLREAPLA